MNKLNIPECYKNMLRWTFQDGIIKAFPKRKLSLLSHKIIQKGFERAGGSFVSNNGTHYFELVLSPRKLSQNGKIAVAFRVLDGQIFEEAQ